MEQNSHAVLLRGRIEKLSKTRRSQDFVFGNPDRTMMSATAVAAGVAGLGGVAAGLAGMAMDITEEADWLEFELDGKRIKAWVWCSVFSNDDEVEIVAERSGDVWQAFGIRRLTDGVVALHPHCSRGRYAHYRATLKWWLVVTVPLCLLSFALLLLMAFLKGILTADWADMLLPAYLGIVFSGLILGAIAYRISRKFMGFVRLAEGIFEGFGWSDVKNIDLPSITKKGKKQGDPGALGVLYFRYCSMQRSSNDEKFSQFLQKRLSRL